ncbi:ribosome hibernation promoting factor HPF [Gammaproteobacteria bacterium]|nr:ribosome hibernation promoting factor HPF [Gammaproteobacteria bacterium]
MQITISGRHLEVTEAIRNYTSEKFARLAKLTDQVTHVSFIISVEKQKQIIEATLSVANAKDIHIGHETEDMYASIDGLMDKLDRKLVEIKKKHLDAARQPKIRDYEP